MAFLLPRTARGTASRPHLGTLPPDHVEVLSGMHVTTAARTVVDLLRNVPDELAAQVVADGALGAGVPRDAVAAVLDYCRGWPGVRQARVAWEHADAGAESPLESRHRALFRRLGLPVPETQVRVRDASGRVVARVDFLFREEWTVVESDGRVKYESAGEPGSPVTSVWDEKRREDVLRDLGLEVVRATYADSVDGGADLADRIRRAFARAARRRAA
jgi:hypothetical protein